MVIRVWKVTLNKLLKQNKQLTPNVVISSNFIFWNIKHPDFNINNPVNSLINQPVYVYIQLYMVLFPRYKLIQVCSLGDRMELELFYLGGGFFLCFVEQE